MYTVYKHQNNINGKIYIGITKLCNGRGKTLKGYHLRYYNDTINAYRLSLQNGEQGQAVRNESPLYLEGEDIV